MTFAGLSGVAGIGFALMLVVVNPVLLRAGLPLPGSGKTLAAISDALAAAGDRIRAPSVMVPVAWLCTTVFAAGMLAAVWRGEPGADGWALVGFAGILMQNVTFAVVEALRFGLVSAARNRGSVAGLWTLTTVLGGFNRVFLTVAMVGFSAAGARVGFLPAWHVWLGYGCGALMLALAVATPYSLDGTRRSASLDSVGWLVGGLAWITWLVACAVRLLVG